MARYKRNVLKSTAFLYFRNIKLYLLIEHPIHQGNKTNQIPRIISVNRCMYIYTQIKTLLTCITEGLNKWRNIMFLSEKSTLLNLI